jgi:hypothetical protein
MLLIKGLPIRRGAAMLQTEGEDYSGAIVFVAAAGDASGNAQK